MTPQSLSDAEFERVHEILERFGDKRAEDTARFNAELAAFVRAANKTN